MAESELDITLGGPEDDSMMLSMNESELLDETTQDSVNDGESSRKSKSFGSRPLPADVLHVEMHPSEVIEYEWPPKSNKKYFIQEQIAQLLGVTSFKRKYPDLTRRAMEPEERKYVVGELNLKMPQHLINNMVVLESVEVHQLMSLQYPEIYKQYNTCVGERKKNERIEQQKKLDALVNDKEKLAELRQEALKAVAEFNKEMNSSLRFKSFYDHHTQLVLVPINKYMKLKPEYTKPVPYPVACFPGQYTTYYRKFSSNELRKLPVQTVLENEQIFPTMKRAMSPPNVLVSEQELQRKIDEEKAKEKKMNSSTEQASPQSTPARITAALNARRQSNVTAICSICNNWGVDEKSLMLQCSSCLSHTHQICLDMPQRMYQVVKTYQWTCIDCKRCTVCMKPDNEDAMMCCDNCDRGYHTFCVGMTEPPTGTWICSRTTGLMKALDEDVDQKYQKLSLEFARLRNEIPALREKLEEEKIKNGNLEDEVRKKDIMIRKLKSDNESLNFRNDQLAKRVENLQNSLDSTTATFAQAKATKKHKEANLRLFGSAALEPCTSSDSPVNSSQLILEQELERKLVENASLHTKLFDMEKQHETVVMEFTAIVRKLEAENELMKKKLIETAAKGFGDPDEDEELTKLMMNDGGDPMKQESAKDMIAELLTDFQKGFEALTQFFSQSDNRSIIYPCDATLESVPEAIHLFGLECGKIAQDLKDLTGIVAMVQMRLTDGLNGETYSMVETKEKIVEIKTTFGELLKNSLKELLPHLCICIRKECEAPWCTPQLDQLNSQFEKMFVTSFQKLSNVFNMIDYTEFDIQKEMIELKKLFHKLRDIFGKKVFIENHLPASSKKLKSLNDTIEKSLLQFVQIISKIQTRLEDKNSVEILTSTLWTRIPTQEIIQNNGKRLTVLEKQASLIEESQTKLIDMKAKLVEFRNKEEEHKEKIFKLNQELAFKDEKIQELQVKIICLEKQIEVLKDSTAEINEIRAKLTVGKNLDDFAVLEFYFCEELNKTVIELENVRGTISRYRKDIDDMTLVLQKFDAEQRDSKCVIDTKTVEIQRLKDELETTCQNYDEQIRVMSDHLAALNAKVVEKSEQLIQMNGSKETKGSGSNSSNGGSFIRKMVKK